MGEKVAILDAGAQYGKVIDRRCREQRIESELLPLDTPTAKLAGNYKAIIISGGPQSVYDEDAPTYHKDIFTLGIPILGICYGMHLMNHALGGIVKKKAIREDGVCEITTEQASPLFKETPTNQQVLMSHGDSIETLAEGFSTSAMSGAIIASIEDTKRKFHGVQFHPEVDLTKHGNEILKNFLYNIAGLKGDYTMEDRQQTAIQYIKETVGDKQVLILVSGGVDSTVCAALLRKALKAEKIHAIHIDNGFMRLKESAQVKEALEHIGIQLKVVDAAQAFYDGTTEIEGKTVGPLKKTISPEAKRKIIGDTFMRVSNKHIETLGLQPEEVYLAQGTLRPDLIESASQLASKKADVIKTHHNDTELVRRLRDEGRVIEPLKDYHKDEVRTLGRELGLPKEIVMRQPFPGPGLAIRIICTKEPYKTERFEEINKELQTLTPNGTHATLLPIQTVGVQGDGRTYSYAAAISGEQDWEALLQAARNIPKQIHDINRIVYVYGKPITEPITDITPTHLTPEVIKQLQEADNIINQELAKNNLQETLSQVPVILIPIGFETKENRTIGIRTFITKDFMTGRPATPGTEIPEKALNTMVQRILNEVQGITRVCYDLTAKPPGTTEWE